MWAGLESHPSISIQRLNVKHLCHGVALNQKKEVWVTVLAAVLVYYIGFNRRKDEAYLSDSTQLCFLVRGTPTFIFVYFDFNIVDSDCKISVDSILTTVNFFPMYVLSKTTWEGQENADKIHIEPSINNSAAACPRESVRDRPWAE
jgi:hypothetical protein